MTYIICRDVGQANHSERNNAIVLASLIPYRFVYKPIHLRGCTIDRLNDTVMFLDGWMENNEHQAILITLAQAIRP